MDFVGISDSATHLIHYYVEVSAILSGDLNYQDYPLLACFFYWKCRASIATRSRVAVLNGFLDVLGIKV
ncbi:MAG TPA: hypothetical protein VGP65_11140, partial [Candidatus Angelobacter sp.]|nr:hypothetical protein [Candidatus Angelobacter sp.]